MRNLLTHLLAAAQTRPLGTLLHVGAGVGGDLDVYEQLAPAHLVLVEGDAVNAGELAAAVEHLGQARIIEKVITPGGERAILHRCSLPLLNSVLPPEDLRSLYPRLRVVEEVESEGIRLAALVASLEVNADELNLLILDVPGLETGLLEPEVLRFFDWIMICASGVSNSALRRSLDDSLEFLQQSQFQVVARDASTDPAWPSALFKRDAVAIENQALKARVAELHEARAGWEQEFRLEISSLVDVHEKKLLRAQEAFHEELQTKLAQNEKALHEAAARHEAAMQEAAALREADALREAALRDQQAAKTEEQLQASRREMENELARARDLSVVLTAGREEQDRVVRELERTCERLTADVHERDLRIRELEEELARQNRLHQRMSEEFVKAESQIELIKEFMMSPQLGAPATAASLP